MIYYENIVSVDIALFPKKNYKKYIVVSLQ